MTEEAISKESRGNIYGKMRFERAEAHEQIEHLMHDFRRHYQDLGYHEVPGVKVSSGIDPTVRFIGSHISVLKPEMIEQCIPQPGEYIIQECIRTKNIREIFNNKYYSELGSSFLSLGTLTDYGRLDEANQESINFFLNKLRLSFDNLRIRISSHDQDLLTSISKFVPAESLEINTRSETYYRHKIGIEGVVGRNFNIALKNADNSGFADVGNVIVIENNQQKLGVETALGTSTILKQLYGLEHVNDCYPIVGLTSVENQVIKRKLEDSIIVSTILLREGLEPRATNNRERLLRTYVRGISYLRVTTGLSLDKITQVIADYESKQFPGTEQGVARKIGMYLQDYEQGLGKRNLTTKEDKIIASALKR